MKKFIKEFKDFINKGNVMDLAVGVIIGGAFQAIVSSLVDDILMPLVSAITGGVNFSDWKVTLGEAITNDAGEVILAPATLTYGNFISALFNFLLMAVVLFLIVKAFNRAKSAVDKTASGLVGKEDEPAPAPTTKICPYCKSEIAIDATRCPHCTSNLE